MIYAKKVYLLYIKLVGTLYAAVLMQIRVIIKTVKSLKINQQTMCTVLYKIFAQF